MWTFSQIPSDFFSVDRGECKGRLDSSPVYMFCWFVWYMVEGKEGSRIGE